MDKNNPIKTISHTSGLNAGMILVLPFMMMILIVVSLYWLTIDSRNAFYEDVSKPLSSEVIEVVQGETFTTLRHFCKKRNVDGTVLHYLSDETQTEDLSYISYINLYSRPMATNSLETGCHTSNFTYAIPAFIAAGEYDFNTTLTHVVNPLVTQVTPFRPIKILSLIHI